MREIERNLIRKAQANAKSADKRLAEAAKRFSVARDELSKARLAAASADRDLDLERRLAGGSSHDRSITAEFARFRLRRESERKADGNEQEASGGQRIMNRPEFLAAMRVAGYHGDSSAFTKLFLQSHVSRKAANVEWQRGANMKSEGIPCSCDDCVDQLWRAVNKHQDLLRRILESLDEPDYNDRGKGGAIFSVFDCRRLPIQLLQEARAAAGLPAVGAEVTR